MILKEDGGINALLGMARSGNNDVIAQVARGMANFAKCESRGIIQGLWPVVYVIVNQSSLLVSIMTNYSCCRT
jgi:hypothetical protein